MRGRVLPWLWLPLLCAASACLPSRNNPFDPQNAPVVTLRVLDGGILGPESCAVPEPAAAVSAASRGRCLALDAGATHDPGGHALTSFRFLFLGTNGVALAQPEELTADAGTASRVSFSRATLLAWPVGPTLDFRAIVRDAAGNVGSGDASIVLLDAPPIAEPMPPVDVPVGGLRWAPGAPVTITLDGRASSDPDGDALTYRWDVGGLGEVTTTSARASFAIPSGVRARYPIALTVFDAPPGGAAFSRPSRLAWTAARVGSPVIWAGPFVQIGAPPSGSQTDSLYERLDPEQALVSPDIARFGIAALDSAGAPIVLTQTTHPESPPAQPIRYTDVWDARTGANRFDSGFPEVFSGQVVAAADDARRRYWFVSDDHFQLDSFAGGAPQTISSFTATTVSEPVTSVAPAVDAAGNFWGVFVDGNGVVAAHAFAPDGTELTSDPADPGYDVTGLGVRPDGSGEVWTVESPSATGSAIAARVVVHRIGSAPMVLPVTLADGSAAGLDWIDEDELWIDVPALGLVRADASQASVDVALDPASAILVVPDVLAGCAVVDAGTKDCWVASTSRTLRIGIDGSKATFPASTPLVASEIGQLWYADAGGSLRRGLVPDPAGTMLSVNLAIGEGAVDASSGGVRVAGLGSAPALMRVAADGAVASYGISVQDATTGAISHVPPLWPFRPSPDGTTAWASALLAGNGVQSAFVYDMTTDPPSVATTSPVMSPAQMQADTGWLLEPAAPVPSSTPFAWIVSNSDSATDVVQIAKPQGGAPIAMFTTQGVGVGSARGARSTASNKLCLGTARSPSSGTVLVEPWVVDPNAAPETPWHLNVIGHSSSNFYANGSYLGPVGASPRDAGGAGELCWVVDEQPTAPSTFPPPDPLCPVGTSDLRAYDLANPVGPPPGVYRQFSVSDGIVQSFAALDGDHVWLSLVRCNAGSTAYEYVRAQLTWNGSGYDSVETILSRPERLLTAEPSR